MSIFKARKQYMVDVGECPRCGGDHPAMLFQALANPLSGNDELFAYCAKTNQPIIVPYSQLVEDPTAGYMNPEDLEAQAQALEKEADGLMAEAVEDAEVREYGGG